MTEHKGVILQGVDVLDVISFIARKNKRIQAAALNQLEGILDNRTEDYKLVRKIFLDSLNNLTRSTLKVIFGDIEDVIR
jgi:hypothetical protein